MKEQLSKTSSKLRVVDREPAAESDAPLLLGESRAIEHLRVDIESSARCDAKVLISGETGVGKEIVARLIHLHGARASQPFLAINCAGVPDSLLESELFGHVRGSFTDAYRDKPGLAVLADRGTLFLDELGEMSPRMQGVLLRFLETGEIHRLGADRIEQKVNVRVIAATNRNLRRSCRVRRFSRGSVLPLERGSGLRSAASRSRQRHPAAVHALLRSLLPHAGDRHANAIASGHRAICSNTRGPATCAS